MNNILLLILLFSLNTVFLSKEGIEISRDQYSATIAIPLGGNAYQTAGSVKEKIGNSGIESWSDHQSEFSIYIKSAEEKQVLLSLELLEQEGNAEILIDFDGASTINLEKGQSGNVPVKEIKLLAGYNQITLKAISKEAADYAKIKNLIFSYEGELSLNYVKDNIDNRFYWGRRGPSVHLTYTLPENQNFKWFYNEVSVPVGQDPIGSYFMANGFGEGYFGIQVNSETERRILFSVWSPFKTDNPNEIPEEEKIKLLKKGEDVYTGEFGNEGSGGQSFLKYPWKAGQTYRFLNSVEPDGNGNTIYTAYFYDPEVGNWILIASFLRPKTDTWYKSPHSFLENFVPQSGNIQRMGEYQNQWAADEFGNWVELTEAKFTGDDIARRGYRMDYAGGSGLGKFYLKNGGFFNVNTPINSIHNRPSQGTAPSIDWDKLP
ncbi:DUF3472 domain-containing protein [Algoriphagus machipongonensis]|uniref:DUF5077 domain-containing protein n=1 Tax=Algoriphagus machipongonensis TaxID=388413 RepID=A3HSI7_9BACT|nr:DUF3472 domain-containing protein [Algoriphagus machipongonensis]EAZ82805.1 hypothetical protein ALPR1_11330 [Algoriphagus machipongonensis]